MALEKKNGTSVIFECVFKESALMKEMGIRDAKNCLVYRNFIIIVCICSTILKVH